MAKGKKGKILRLALANAPLAVMAAMVLLLSVFDVPKDSQINLSYFESEDASITPFDLMKMPPSVWSPATKSELRYPTSNYLYRWSRLDLAPADTSSGRFYAEIADPFQEAIDFFLFENNELIQRAEKGYDRHDLKPDISLLSDVFAFGRSETSSRTLLIRTAARGKVPLALRVMTEKDYHEGAKYRRVILGLAIGCALGMFIYNLFLFFATRDLGFLWYSVFMAAMSGESLFLAGPLRVFLPQAAKNIAFFSRSIQILFLVGCAALILFEQQYCAFSVGLSRVRRLDKIILSTLAAIALLVFVLPPQFSTIVVIGSGTIMLLTKQVQYSKYLRHRRALQYSGLVSAFIGTWLVSYAAWFGVIARVFAFETMYLVGSIIVSCFFSSMLAVRQRQVEAKRKRIIMSLTQKPNLAAVGQSPTATGETSEVCIMFVDIVSFSQMFAPMPSRHAFSELANRIRQISGVVASFGGSVDRSLGDGLLCFFGGEPGASMRDGVMNAFLAAIRIQEMTVAEALQPSTSRRTSLIMPLRIGIHCASVSMGNIGGQARIDFTMVGSGVNFARRLETACSPFKLIVSNECREQLIKAGVKATGFSEIAISIKHQTNLVTACEFDPFHDRADLLREVEQLYFDQLGVQSFDRIVDVRDEGSIRLESAYGSFAVKDFSLYGFRVGGNDLFGQRSLLKVKIVTNDPEVNRKLEEKLLDHLTVEVRWGRGAAHGFEHGLRIYGGNKGIRNFLYDLLRSRFGVAVDSAYGADLFREIA